MSSKFTRRRFLTLLGASCLTLTGAAGCEPLGRVTKLGSLHMPMVRPLRVPEVWLLPSVSSAPSKGAWSFRSRPDLSPPVVEVTKQASDTAPGYVFVAPEGGDAGQGGSMIFDNEGRVVWFRHLQGSHGRAMDLKMQSYRGKPVLTWIETVPGEYVIFDDFYRETARLTAGNGHAGDHHEFLISPQDTALITVYSPVRRDLSSVGGGEDSVAVEGIVQELDIETGEILFEWHSLEHVGLDESYAKPGEDVDTPGIDYFHINSIDVDHDDNLLVSARETSTVYKIDRATGEVMWRLGGKRSDFEMKEGARFAFQHDARRLPDGTISIFDNGTTVFKNGFPEAIEESRAIVLEVDEKRMIASLAHEYTHPDERRADAAGNTQVLRDGHVFVGWGRALTISEFSHEGELLFDASLPRGNKSYRAFRFPWRGYPTDRPACVAERASEEEARVYASWNGATEVASWEVLTGQRVEHLKSLGSVPRDGFETAMAVRTLDSYVVVRAKDGSGRVLGTSKPVEI
jgi:Arylsulfotransferase (ASST)